MDQQHLQTNLTNWITGEFNGSYTLTLKLTQIYHYISTTYPDLDKDSLNQLYYTAWTIFTYYNKIGNYVIVKPNFYTFEMHRNGT